MPSPPGLKKALNFAKFHARGGRGLQPGHPRIGAPLPGHSPRRARRGGTPGGRHTPAATPRRRTTRAHPGGGRLPSAGRRVPGGLPLGRRLRPGLHWAHGRGGYPGRAVPRKAGYRAKQGGFCVARRGFRGAVLQGGLPRAATDSLCRGGYPAGSTGARLPGGGRRGGTAPGRGGYPGGYRGARRA